MGDTKSNAATPTELADTGTVVAGCLIFFSTWLLITFERVPILPIGRTAGALVGSSLMVATGVLTGEEAYNAVDMPTLALLFWTMLMSEYLRLRADAFKHVTNLMTWKSPPDSRILLIRMSITFGVVAAFFTNDTVCVSFTPLVLEICKGRVLPFQPFLLALATSANIGSAATAIGNPQNMLIASLGDISFLYFLLHLLPAVVASMFVNIVLLLLFYWRRLSADNLGSGPTLWCCPSLFSRKPKKTQTNDSSGDANPGGLIVISMIDRASPRPPASTMTESSLSDNTLDTSPDSGAVEVCDEKSGCAAEDAEGKSALAAMPPLPALEEENTLAGCLQSEMEGERHDDEDIRCLPLSYIPYFRRKPLVRRYIWGATVGLVMVLVVAGFVGGLPLSWVAAGGGLLLLIIDWRDSSELLRRVDYSVLVVFTGLFMVVAGFNKTGVPAVAWEAVAPYCSTSTAAGLALLTVIIVVMSNVASNVPTVLILGPQLAQSSANAGGDENMAWMLLAFVSTVAGNALMAGSMANLIVAERARESYSISFWNHLRFGLLSTIVVCVIGVPLVWVTFL